MKRDQNKFDMWREMRKFYVHVETPLSKRVFIILADDELLAVANYWIRALNRVEYSTEQSIDVAFNATYLVHEGRFEEAVEIDTAQLIWLNVFSDEDRRTIQGWVEQFSTSSVYEHWLQRVKQFAPVGSKFLTDKDS